MPERLCWRPGDNASPCISEPSDDGSRKSNASSGSGRVGGAGWSWRRLHYTGTGCRDGAKYRWREVLNYAGRVQTQTDVKLRLWRKMKRVVSWVTARCARTIPEGV